MFLYILVGLVAGTLVATYFIKHKQIEEYLDKRVAMVSTVSIEVMVMIVTALISGFGTVAYWLHARIKELENEEIKRSTRERQDGNTVKDIQDTVEHIDDKIGEKSDLNE